MRLRSWLGFFVVATSGVTWLFACSNTTFESSSDEAAPEGGADAASGADEAGCPHGQGPTMTPILNQPFCIDSTEVTNAQYQSFLEAISGGYMPAEHDPLAADGGSCSWNTAYNPSAATSCASATSGGASQPVTCVDWCDAHSYCIWAGKHLCGATAAQTTPLDVADSVVATNSQWELACSALGTRNYPYGNDFDASSCNTSALKDGGSLSDVASFSGCVGGYPGIFDMAGNAAEWVDACEDGGNSGSIHDNCAELGDSYSDNRNQNPGGCAVKDYYPRGSTNPDVGFRCCSN